MHPPLKERLSHSREIAGRISESIYTGRLLPGEKLGSIRCLANRFGVGRQVILSAIGLLSDSGLVVTKAKTGTYVNPTLDRRLVKDRTKRIGLLSWRIRKPPQSAFSIRLLQNVLRTAPQHNCEVFWQAEMAALDPVQWMTEARLDALLVTGLVDDDLVRTLNQAKVTYLVVGNYELQEPASQISLDLVQDARLVLGRLLARHQFRRLALAVGPADLAATRQLCQGAKLAVNDNKMTWQEELCVRGQNENGFAAMKQVMTAAPGPPDAILLTARAFPGVAQYIFEHRLHRNNKKPFLILDFCDTAYFYPEMVDACIYEREVLGDIALERLIGLYFGSLDQPWRENVTQRTRQATTTT